MKLIELVLKAKKAGLSYIAIDEDASVFGFEFEPFHDYHEFTGLHTWYTQLGAIKHLGYHEYPLNFNTTKSIININKLTLRNVI